MALHSPASIQGPGNPPTERKGNWERPLDAGQLRAAQVVFKAEETRLVSSPACQGEAPHVSYSTLRMLVNLETVSLVK